MHVKYEDIYVKTNIIVRYVILEANEYSFFQLLLFIIAKTSAPTN